MLVRARPQERSTHALQRCHHATQALAQLPLHEPHEAGEEALVVQRERHRGGCFRRLRLRAPEHCLQRLLHVDGAEVGARERGVATQHRREGGHRQQLLEHALAALLALLERLVAAGELVEHEEQALRVEGQQALRQRGAVHRRVAAGYDVHCRLRGRRRSHVGVQHRFVPGRHVAQPRRVDDREAGTQQAGRAAGTHDLAQAL